MDQFELIRIEHERLEEERLKNPFYRSAIYGDLNDLIEAIETKAELLPNFDYINHLISYYQEWKADEYLWCLEYAIENGFTYDATIFSCFGEDKCQSIDIFECLIRNYKQDQKRLILAFNCINQPMLDWFGSILEDGKIDLSNEKSIWKSFLTDLYHSTTRINSSFKEQIRKALCINL